MNRSTVTTFMKANGAKVIFSDGPVTGYGFKDEAKIYEVRESIPYLNQFMSGYDGLYVLNVYFDRLMNKDCVDKC